MSHMDLKKPVDLILKNGISFGCLLKITTQKHLGRKVIMDLKCVYDETRLTIALDDSDHLSIELVDDDGEHYSLVLTERNQYFNVDLFFVFSLEIVLEKIELNIVAFDLVGDRKISEKVSVQPALGDCTQFDFVVGSSVEHTDPAAFTIAELFFYNRTLAIGEKKGLFMFVKNKRGF